MRSLAEAAARWPFSWRRWLQCLLSRAGHDWYLTHQRRVTDYYVCRRCGQWRMIFAGKFNRS